jgi:hypothetical protein
MTFRLTRSAQLLGAVASTFLLAGPIALRGAPALPSYSRATTPPDYGRVDRIVAVLDFNGDGREDLLVGGDANLRNTCVAPADRPLPPPLRVMLSEGDGTFRDGTASVIERSPDNFLNPVWPHGVVADFNGDGHPDIAVFTDGTECGVAPNHTYVGYPPVLLLSGTDGRWRPSTALADAVANYHAAQLPQYVGANLRALSACAGDINEDGRPDIWVESKGGENVRSHFLINNADGTFVVDVFRVPSAVIHNPLPEVWRYWGTALADMNNDGHLDLVMGQIRDTNPTHVNEASLVLINDGRGQFTTTNRILLPHADFASGYTTVNALAVVDLDGDGRRDIILTHHRNLASTTPYAGRYVQILMNSVTGFVDETTVRMGDQSATTAIRSDVYARDLKNQVDRMFLADVNHDGTVDFVLNSQFPIGTEAPLAHLNDGRGVFTVMDPDTFTNRELYFGENSVPIDLNGDGLIDFVHLDAVPGPDRTYGTRDDATQIISLTGHLPN